MDRCAVNCPLDVLMTRPLCDTKVVALDRWTGLPTRVMPLAAVERWPACVRFCTDASRMGVREAAAIVSRPMPRLITRLLAPTA